LTKIQKHFFMNSVRKLAMRGKIVLEQKTVFITGAAMGMGA